jgi:dihydrofolate reductase
MGKVRVDGYTVSLDGFGAAPGQSLENPFGVGGLAIMGWMESTKMFADMIGGTGGSTGIDHQKAVAGMQGLGAWILGRNMFSPDRGPWENFDWKGWWGPNPPYHVPTFILTHYPRESIPMEGGTVFHFVTGGIREALERAREAAGVLDVRVGGGAATIRQYLEAGLIDEMNYVVAPVLLGAGESPINGLNLPALGYAVTEKTFGENAMHVTLRRNNG